ncbi:MAG: hypothetical protein AB9866_16735 [Syntrophobacteraceae bacterium]
MKAIRVILVIAVVMTSVFGLYTPEAKAAAAWYTCSVLEAGPAPVYSWGKYRFKLTDDGAVFTGKYFYAETGFEKEMLAVALTAIANGKKVKIYADNSGSVPKVTLMYLVN